MQILLVLILVSAHTSLLVASSTFIYENYEEWNTWKMTHEKGYSFEQEEQERHLIWLSNKKYIDSHNMYADYMGFKLAMNMFGDMVSKTRSLF